MLLLASEGMHVNNEDHHILTEESLYYQLIEYLLSKNNSEQKKEKFLNQLLNTPQARASELVQSNLLFLYYASEEKSNDYDNIGKDVKEIAEQEKNLVKSLLKDCLY